MRLPRLINPPVLPDEHLSHRASTLHFIIWSILLVFDTQFWAAFLVLPENWPRWAATLAVLNSVLLFLLMLNKRGHTQFASVSLLMVLWMISTGLALTAGGIHAPAIWGYVVTVLVAGLLFGGNGGLVAGIVFCATGLGMVLLEKSGHLPGNAVVTTPFSHLVNLVIVLELIALFQFLATRSVRLALRSAQEELAQRRQAEMALSESEQRYREVFETTSDPLFSMDVTADGRFVFNRWNPACEKIVGFPSAESVGKEAWQVFPRDLAAVIVSDARQCLTQGSPLILDRTVELRGKRYHFHSTIFPIKNKTGKISRLFCVAHNVTERKEAEDALRRSHEELELRVQERTAELQKVNRELEAFTYSVSHDLRRPLRTVTGFTDLLMESHANELSDDAKNLLSLVRQSAVQMNQLVEALLSLSRVDRQPLQCRPVDLAELARQVMKDLQGEQSGRKVELHIDEMSDCLGDPDLLRQVFANLLSNAVKFTAHRPVGIIEVGCRDLNGETVYFVRDNGAGFDMQYANKLFGVFQRLHSADEFSGTGVGLSIVQRVIHRHGGTIWAEAAVDQGATFYFTLPPAKKEAKETAHNGIGGRLAHISSK